MSSAASRLATAVITSAHSSASLSTVEQNLKCWQLSRHITAPCPSVQRFSHALNTSADSSRIFSAWGLSIDGFGNVSIMPRLTGKLITVLFLFVFNFVFPDTEFCPVALDNKAAFTRLVYRATPR